MLNQYNKILAIGAHPDDIEPQSAGTLLKFIENGAQVSIAIATLTDTGASKKVRSQEGHDAAKMLGAKYYELGISQKDFKHNRRTIQKIDLFFSKIKPDLVICVNGDDSHNDHQTLYKIVKSCNRKNEISLLKQNHTIPGGINLGQPNVFFDISKYRDKKYEAIKAHKSQVEKFGAAWIETISARDKYLGSLFGVDAVEGFYSICLKIN